MSDAYQRFAEECGLRLEAEALAAVPRNVLAPLSAVEQPFLVSLSRLDSSAEPVRLVFLTPIASGAAPSMQDVLWWLAGDAWVLEQGDRRLDRWAATYGYSPREAGISRLFEQSLRQSAALSELLGESNMRRLLVLYEAEITPIRAP